VKRRVLVVTEATYEAMQYALRYLVDTAVWDDAANDYIGDNGKREVERSKKAQAAIADAPVRDVKADRRAILNVADAACENSCSCVDLVDKPHSRDCFVQTARRDVDRVVAVADILTKEGQ
jgi:hypothetical protein